ncbi:hypothetical protein MKEN_00071400 [Mycena kentingensis (nom. inval.)]|nr:hypothetical protein MKEN_00071400 [Mycena kentingensis (nom. inval.)]
MAPRPAPLEPAATTGRVPRGLWKANAHSKPNNPSASFHHRADDEVYYYIQWDAEDNAMETAEEAAPSVVDDKPFEDWEDLKELFGKAVEQYDNNDEDALQLLRGVIHEAHRFLLLYDDPSTLWTVSRSSKSPEPISASPSTKPTRVVRSESPTAFHAILGTALFLFGNLVSQNPSLAVEGEPTSAPTYWLAALDVFETGDRTCGRGCDNTSMDWRLAISWGRTLLAVTEWLLDERPPPPPEQKYPNPSASPFAAIAFRRPPACRRISFSTTSPHELLLLAMDQFTRGIFHMPHPAHDTDVATDARRPFSRATELFSIASQVLAIAERLPVAKERVRWAEWSDSILQQMDMEGDTARDEWRGPVTKMRGQAWLVVGTAQMDTIEGQAEERGWDAVLDSEEAEDAREGLERAVEYFEKAVGSAKREIESEDEGMPVEQDQVQAYLAEALLTLANLTKDEAKREEMYQRAQEMSGESLDMDVDDDE